MESWRDYTYLYHNYVFIAKSKMANHINFNSNKISELLEHGNIKYWNTEISIVRSGMMDRAYAHSKFKN